MPQNASSPGAVAAHGARKDVHAGSLNAFQNSPHPSDLQALWLRRRFAVPVALAHVVAEIAFPSREARP